MKLKTAYKEFKEKKEKDVLYFNSLFKGEGNQRNKYLAGATLPAKIKRELNTLYYSSPIANILINGEYIHEHEYSDLKKDMWVWPVKNGDYWVKSYLLSWIMLLRENPTPEYFYFNLDVKESKKAIILDAYKV